MGNGANGRIDWERFMNPSVVVCTLLSFCIWVSLLLKVVGVLAASWRAVLKGILIGTLVTMAIVLTLEFIRGSDER